MKKLLSLIFALVISVVAFYFFKQTRTSGEALRDLCSCLYVMDRDEAMCRKWTGLDESAASIDTDARRVFKHSLSSAWLSTQEGCSEVKE